MDIAQALRIIDKTVNDIVAAYDSKDLFVFKITKKGESFTTVDKSNGKIGTMWISDVFDYPEGYFKRIDLSKVRAA